MAAIEFRIVCCTRNKCLGFSLGLVIFLSLLWLCVNERNFCLGPREQWARDILLWNLCHLLRVFRCLTNVLSKLYPNRNTK